MKKIFALTMALLMSISMAGCGNSSGENAAEVTTEMIEEPSLWTTSLSVDEFGDVTDDSETLLVYPIEGTFTNTATENDELGGSLCFRRHPNKLHYVMEIKLEEYKNTPVTFYSGDDLILKTKDVGDISEYKLDGEAPDSNLYLGINPDSTGGNTGADNILSSLYQGNDVRCIIEIGSSTYNFTIESKGFDKICQENGFIPTTEKDFFKVVMGIEDPMKEVLQICTELMHNDFSNQELYNTIICSYLNPDALLTTDEIKEKINGCMLQFDIVEANDLGYSISTFREAHPEVNPSGKSYVDVECSKYSEDNCHCYGFMMSPSRAVGISSFDNSCSFFGEDEFLASPNQAIEIHENKITFSADQSYAYDRYFCEAEPGIYLLIEDYNGFLSVETIFFACDEPLTSKEMIIEQLEKMINNR